MKQTVLLALLGITATSALQLSAAGLVEHKPTASEIANHHRAGHDKSKCPICGSKEAKNEKVEAAKKKLMDSDKPKKEEMEIIKKVEKPKSSATLKVLSKAEKIVNGKKKEDSSSSSSSDSDEDCKCAKSDEQKKGEKRQCK